MSNGTKSVLREVETPEFDDRFTRYIFVAGVFRFFLRTKCVAEKLEDVAFFPNLPKQRSVWLQILRNLILASNQSKNRITYPEQNATKFCP